MKCLINNDQAANAMLKCKELDKKYIETNKQRIAYIYYGISDTLTYDPTFM